MCEVLTNEAEGRLETSSTNDDASWDCFAVIQYQPSTTGGDGYGCDTLDGTNLPVGDENVE